MIRFVGITFPAIGVVPSVLAIVVFPPVLIIVVITVPPVISLLAETAVPMLLAAPSQAVASIPTSVTAA